MGLQEHVCQVKNSSRITTWFPLPNLSPSSFFSLQHTHTHKNPVPKYSYLQGALRRTKTPNWNQDLDLPLRRKQRFPNASLPLLISYTSVVSENCKTVFTRFRTAWGCLCAAGQRKELVLYTTVQPSGSEWKLCPSAAKLPDIVCRYFSIWKTVLTSNTLAF